MTSWHWPGQRLASSHCNQSSKNVSGLSYVLSGVPLTCPWTHNNRPLCHYLNTTYKDIDKINGSITFPSLTDWEGCLVFNVDWLPFLEVQLGTIPSAYIFVISTKSSRSTNCLAVKFITTNYTESHTTLCSFSLFCICIPTVIADHAL